MSDFPDILGMELHDAAALLEAEGLPFVITETNAVKREVSDGVFRVVRVQPQISDRVVLTVCRI
ncbi:MAG TPA: hypothetical protein VN381_14090 [Anaerovoracaceae bacterium]|nr:hypothetical protein [Anaerovoracaceae bacterium]